MPAGALVAWEQGQVWRDDSAQTSSFSQGEAVAPVFNISCLACQRRLSWQGMQSYYKGDPSSLVYSANSSPNGTSEEDHTVKHGLCACKMREFQCACGTIVGYHMYTWCSSCGTNDEGHDWLFYADCIAVEPRCDPGTGELLIWPDAEQVQMQGSRHITEHRSSSKNARAVRDRLPLAEDNGRSHVSLGKPDRGLGQFEAQLEQKELHLRTRESELQGAWAQHAHMQEELVAREAFLTEQMEDLAVRDRHLQNQAHRHENIIDKGQEYAKLALDRCEQKLAVSEAQTDALRVQIVEHERVANGAEAKVADQNIQIQQLHDSLAEMRRKARSTSESAGFAGDPAKHIPLLEQEIAEMRTQLKHASQCLQSKDAELNRLAPEIAKQTSLRMKSKDDEVSRLRHELDLARSHVLQLRPDFACVGDIAPKPAPAIAPMTGHVVRERLPAGNVVRERLPASTSTQKSLSSTTTVRKGAGTSFKQSLTDKLLGLAGLGIDIGAALEEVPISKAEASAGHRYMA